MTAEVEIWGDLEERGGDPDDEVEIWGDLEERGRQETRGECYTLLFLLVCLRRNGQLATLYASRDRCYLRLRLLASRRSESRGASM